jgi:hypothetical protein
MNRQGVAHALVVSLLSVVGCLWPAPVQAVIMFDIASDVPAHTFVDGSTSVTGSIAVDPTLLQYGVQTAELYVLLDYSQVQYVFTNTSPYTLDPSGQGYVRRSTENWYDPRVDTIVADVRIEGQTLPATFYKYVHEVYQGQTSFLGPDNNYYYTDNYVDSVDEFAFVIPLDPTSLSNLLADGRIDFTVSAGSGDFYFQLAKLSGVANDAPHPVPDPASLLLLPISAAAVAWMRRRWPRRE